jgi:hypothetical protein
MVIGTLLRCGVGSIRGENEKGKANLLTHFEGNVLKQCGGLQKARD